MPTNDVRHLSLSADGALKFKIQIHSTCGSMSKSLKFVLQIVTGVSWPQSHLPLQTYQQQCSWFIQVVQDIPSPIPFDIPMVLIKPQEACSTAEVYKVIQMNL